MSATAMVMGNSLPGRAPRAVAPAWHTGVVLFCLFGFSLLGALRHDWLGTGDRARVANYVLIIAFEWVLVAFISGAARRRGVSLRELVGGRWARAIDVLRDLGIGIGFLIGAGALLQGLSYLVKPAPSKALLEFLPHGAAQMMLWVCMSLTAGFCEEVIFRGYLQRQFAALTQGAIGGIVLQGVVFGASHGYQGWKLMMIISVFGMMFGMLAYWVRSLRPGMLAHFLQDGIGGIAGRRLMG